jgi:hypothetical protein
MTLIFVENFKLGTVICRIQVAERKISGKNRARSEAAEDCG